MPWLRRSELSWNERYRRCLYFFLRDSLDTILLDESLIKSYKQFQLLGTDYPFVEMRELKPRAKVYGPEYSEQRHFIVILNEETLAPESKKHIRFLDSNKLTKENLATMALFDLQEIYRQKMRYFEDSEFATILRKLLSVDFAVLIQRDPSIKARYRYALTHFHVQIDWPVADASLDLGRYLRYVSRDLYEKGDKVAEILQQKLYEYYGFHYTVGGRRTAALVAARYMTRFDHISTVYVSSSESRTLFRISEQGIYKYVLIQLSNKEIKELAEQAGIKERAFAKSYLIDRNRDFGVGIFLVSYQHNEHSRPPVDGKLRELTPDYQWLNVDLQLLIPPPGNGNVRPLTHSRVYT